MIDGIFKQVYHGKRSGTFSGVIKLVDGKILQVEASVGIIFDESGNASGFRGILRDISARKKAEEEKKRLEIQLQQAQKLEALGTLAGGIAHDFNNLLMGIQGRASLMLMDSNSVSPHYEHLKGIENYVQSAAGLTRQLLGFARGGKYEVKALDLNELVSKAAEMFGRTKKEITLHSKFADGLWPVEADHSQINQVLLNIFVNAWQAMPGGGHLYLQTGNEVLQDIDVTPFGLTPGRYVKISITDTGIGMDEAIQQRIFDPFFTTKEKGRGTGLGLASAYGIINNHGGIIRVASKPGEGATFSIYLPASNTTASGELEKTDDLIAGHGTVLLVDDEEMIVDVGGHLLKRLGYDVYIARSGEEALDIYQREHKNITLVLLDMIMPGIGGGETFARLKRMNPEIRVLLSSGYSIDGQAARIMEQGCRGFIQKPFSLEQLSQKIREALD
jgi:signal transduction histidine kinase/CheY-like chemotaxis protein